MEVRAKKHSRGPQEPCYPCLVILNARSKHLDQTTIDDENGRLFVSVPWDRAERCRRFLRRRGFGSTLHLDPRNRTACLAWLPRRFQSASIGPNPHEPSSISSYSLQ